MDCLEKTSNVDYKIAPLKLGNGWGGKVVLNGTPKTAFTMADWAKCLSKPDSLFDDIEKTLKTENKNCVAVKNFTISQHQLKTVIKRHHPQRGLRQFFRSFRAGKALRNLKTSIKLLSCKIPTAKPFVAIHQKHSLLTSQSIFISEYLENSMDLYHFLEQQLPWDPAERFAIKKQLSREIAVILATLHKNNLWHRDSKAYNFLVIKDTQNQYKIILVDIDGIKPYLLRRKKQQFRSLWRLAASVMPLDVVSQTDYLRTFINYCNLIGLKGLSKREALSKIASAAKLKYMQITLKELAEK